MHLSVLLGQSAEATQHKFCDTCYPAAEAERIQAYSSHPSNPLPIRVENITAEELIAASERAQRNGADKPVLRHILSEVDRFPEAKQRLALEVLKLAKQSLDQWDEPQQIAFVAGCWNVIEPHRMPEYIDGLEKLAVQCFDQRAESQDRSPLGPFVMPLSMALTTLARISPGRFTAIIHVLKARGGDEKFGDECKVIALAEQFAARLNPQ